jgi:hypothetical protein
MSGLVAATWIVVEPPQHQPVTATRSARAPGCFFAKSTAALRSPRICWRGCAFTILRMSWMFCRWATPPERPNGSGATAKNPSLAKRRVESRMYSWMPQISAMTRTMGALPASGRAQ